MCVCVCVGERDREREATAVTQTRKKSLKIDILLGTVRLTGSNWKKLEKKLEVIGKPRSCEFYSNFTAFLQREKNNFSRIQMASVRVVVRCCRRGGVDHFR